MSKLQEAAGFRVGDEVESTLPNIEHIGIILNIESYIEDPLVTSYDYLYTIGDYGRKFDETEIRHTKKLANPLNRKLYPNYIEEEGYLYRKKED